MTIWTLVAAFAAFGLLATAFMRIFKIPKDLLASFLQNFCGIWFFVSGAVKAIDPAGTAIKMEQYFDEFETTLAGTWLKPLSGIFPWLGEHAIGFAIFMIVLELLVGLMLILGIRNKLTAWVFWVTLVFFTVLTGFTFLTGYVPRSDNFFDFAKWGPFLKENMRVTDCGCFGDFLKLDPRVSFTKDIFLLFPGLFFLFKHRSMHQVGSKIFRGAIWILSLLAFGAYCFYYTFFNEPAVDFRPFREGVNIRTQKQAELDAESDRQITGWSLQDLQSKKTFTLTDAEYMGNLKNYPRERFKVLDQIKTDPKIKSTKLTEFSIYDEKDEDFTAALLSEPKSALWILTSKIPVDRVNTTKQMVADTIFTSDTIISKTDTLIKMNPIPKIVSQEVEIQEYTFNAAWLARLNKKIAPLAKAAMEKSQPVYVITPFVDIALTEALKKQFAVSVVFLHADDVLLKTIMRSNPGLMVVKNGQILAKYHFEHLPSSATLIEKMQ